ncbi:unnamed protein product [Jaminaea pallidilutea]
MPSQPQSNAMAYADNSHSPSPSQVFRPSALPSHLPDFPYTPHYAHFGSVRYAYIDERPGVIWDLQTGSRRQALTNGEELGVETIVCLHGEPSWSYLYRKMIPKFLDEPPAPRLVAPGEPRFIRRRLVAPDFIGFGRSDKPTEDSFYTWETHRAWLVSFIRNHVEFELAGCHMHARTTLVVQDWGGLLGLILPHLYPHLFTNLIVMNTGLGTGKSPSKGWNAFRDYMANTPNVEVGKLMQRGTPLSNEEAKNYDLPFEGEGGGQRAKAGVRRFPQLVPILPTQAGVAESAAAKAYYASLTPLIHNASSSSAIAKRALSVFVCIGASDPVLGEPVMDALNAATWGKRRGYWRHVIPDAGHFVQEWAAHIPQLADTAFAAEKVELSKMEAEVGRQKTVGDSQGHKAEWKTPTEASPGSKL